MYNAVMSHGYIVPYDRGQPAFPSAAAPAVLMNGAVVLDIGITANPDAVYIGAQNRVVPDAASFPDHDIANQNRPRGNKHVLAHNRQLSLISQQIPHTTSSLPIRLHDVLFMS